MELRYLVTTLCMNCLCVHLHSAFVFSIKVDIYVSTNVLEQHTLSSYITRVEKLKAFHLKHEGTQPCVCLLKSKIDR